MNALRLLLRASLRHSPNSLRAMSSTVDKAEIAHFSSLAAEWWDEEGSMRALHSMNAVRVPWIVDEVSDGTALTTILDVGCGCGLLAEPLARRGLEVTGVDASSDCISVARARLTSNRLPVAYVHQTDTLSHAVDGRLFDAVVASEVVEHVTDVDAFLASLASCLRPGGALFLTTINRTAVSNLLAIYGAEYVLRVVPRGTHEHDKFVTPDELTSKLEALNLTASPARGLLYNPVCNSWSWTTLTNVNYALMARKC